MRLSLVSDDGQAMDIPTALRQQPLATRALLADALFECQTILPDTLGYIQTEQAIRDTLLQFQADQERHIRSYVLSRTLDHRIQKTPRAEVLYQSFHYGGPLALIGIFYATLDAHRNLRNRETLEFFLQKASTESKLDLMQRVGILPCHPSIDDWLLRIFHKLETDSRALACMLRYLGTTGIPQNLFRRARGPSFTWDSSGSPVGLVSRVTPCIQKEEIFRVALRNLEHVGFAYSDQESISLNAKIAERLQPHLESTQWAAEAAKIVIHAYPKYRDIDSSDYNRECELLMPQLEHIITGIITLQGIPVLDHTYLMQLTEAGLSASNFRDQSWKTHVVTVATRAASALESRPERAFYIALARVREASLAHLYRAHGEWLANSMAFPTYDDRSNAFAAQLMIVKAWENLSLNALTSAFEHMKTFTPVWDGTVSRLGALYDQEIMLMRAKVLRCEGRFQEAYDILATLTPRNARIRSQIGYVLCELGRSDEAISELQCATSKSQNGKTHISVALANVHLVKCMQALRSGQGSDWSTLQTSREIYQGLRAHAFPATYFGKVDWLSVLMGLAIADHMDGQVDSALRAWQSASAASQTFLPTGYTDMIFAYSTSELQMRRGATAQSEILRNYAKALYSRAGRQHHFVGLGSFWPDIVNAWFADKGQEPVIP